jgi:hypothetical protein
MGGCTWSTFKKDKKKENCESSRRDGVFGVFGVFVRQLPGRSTAIARQQPAVCATPCSVSLIVPLRLPAWRPVFSRAPCVVTTQAARQQRPHSE